jgi:hypothetical protein
MYERIRPGQRQGRASDGTWLAMFLELRKRFDLNLDWTTFGSAGERKSKVMFTVVVDADTTEGRQATARDELSGTAERVYETANRDPNWSWQPISGLRNAIYEA